MARQPINTTDPGSDRLVDAFDKVNSNDAELYGHVGSTDGHPASTTTAPGFQSAADKAKTDNLSQVCQVQRTTDLLVSHAAWTPVPWNSEQKDAQNWHDPTTNTERITLPAGGFLVTASMTWNANTTGVRHIRIQHYSAAGASLGTYSSPGYNTSSGGDGYGRSSTPMAYIDTSANDYLIAEVYQNSGAALNFGIGAVSTLPTPTFTAVRLR